MNKIFLYGLGGPRDHYRVLKVQFIFQENFSTNILRYTVEDMRIRNPSIKQVFMISNRKGLNVEYRKAIKENSIESCVIFRDTLEREGVEIRY